MPRPHRPSPLPRLRRRTITLPSWLPVDWYLLALLGTVALAALLPVGGRAATVTDGATTVAVAFLTPAAPPIRHAAPR